jgi:U3 small nucleolar RNA-associated protein 10
MLANRYAMDKDVLVLMTGLVSDASAPVELTVRVILPHFWTIY